jgi:hypothetical protein
VSDIKNNKVTTGVIYVATGKSYIKSAIMSARSLRKHSPGVSIHLFANWKECGLDFDKGCEPFTSIVSVEQVSYHLKVDCMRRTPFDRTLFIDADTRIVADINSVFSLMDRFDIAMVHAQERVRRIKNWQVDVPDCFPEFNSGVIVFKKTEKVFGLLKKWQHDYHEAKSRNDQMTLREALWLSDLRIATLPPEYNIRYLKYLFLWGKREAKNKILHLRYYRRGIFWFIYPWIISLIILYKKIMKIENTTDF